MKNLISQKEIEELLSCLTDESEEFEKQDNSLEIIAELLDETEECLSKDKHLNAGLFYEKLLLLQSQIINGKRD